MHGVDGGLLCACLRCLPSTILLLFCVTYSKLDAFFSLYLFAFQLWALLIYLLETGGGYFYSPLMIESLTKYFQWFVMGLIVKHYFNTIKKFISKSHNRIITCSIVLFVVLFWISQESQVPFVIHKFVHDIAVRYMGLICVFLIFFSFRDYFEQSGVFQNGIKFIGRRTLDIYLLHNFFLPDMFFMRPILEGRLLLEIVFYLCTSLIIVAVCLGSSQIIRRSDTLAYWCFGSKQQIA